MSVLSEGDQRCNRIWTKELIRKELWRPRSRVECRDEAAEVFVVQAGRARHAPRLKTGRMLRFRAIRTNGRAHSLRMPPIPDSDTSRELLALFQRRYQK